MTIKNTRLILTLVATFSTLMMVLASACGASVPTEAYVLFGALTQACYAWYFMERSQKDLLSKIDTRTKNTDEV